MACLILRQCCRFLGAALRNSVTSLYFCDIQPPRLYTIVSPSFSSLRAKLVKKLLLVSAALVGLAGAAAAADLPGPVVAPAPVGGTPAFTWAGVYGGFNAGAAWRNEDRFRLDPYPTTFARPEIPLCGFSIFPGVLIDCIPLATAGTRPVVFSGTTTQIAAPGRRNDVDFTVGSQVGVQGQWGIFVGGLEFD